MKKLKVIGALLFTMVISVSIYAFDISDKVPQKVQDAFILKFPEVSVVEWEKESEMEWEAEFDIKGVEYSANFLSDGTWVETEHEIRKRDIPKNIKTVLKSKFLKHRIKKAEMAETHEGTVYEVKLRKGKQNLEVVLDINGVLLKQSNSED